MIDEALMRRRWWTGGVFWETLALALTVVFGLQLVRVLLPELVFYLRDGLGASPAVAGVYALLVFCAGFLSPLVLRRLGVRGSLFLAGGCLSLVRLAEQLSSSPALDLALTSVGTLLFLWSISIYVVYLRARGNGGGQAFALGFLLGMALDTAVKGTFATLDLSWEPGVPGHLVVGLMVAGYLLLRRTLAPGLPPRLADAPPSTNALPLVALGPIFFLGLLLFQNIGQQTALSGWNQPAIFAWLVMSNAFGIGVASAVMAVPALGVRLAAAAVGGLLVLLAIGERSGMAAGLVSLYGQAALAMSVGTIGVAIGSSGPGADVRYIAVATGLGTLLFLALAFLYYGNYQFDMPGGTRVVPPLAAGIVLASILPVAFATSKPQSQGVILAPLVGAVLLLALPLGYLAGWEEPRHESPSGLPVRIMTYNLHQGFDAGGTLAIKDQARVIAEASPDIVALQEVSRGWVIDGSFDMLVWLSRRLDMPYVWGPAADSVWGNAILSRYPILEARTIPMPNNGQLQMDRGYTLVRVDVGDGGPVTVIATHMHHLADEEHLRVPQVQALLEAWDGSSRSIILGDFNAIPEGPAVGLLREAGLSDAYESAGRDLGEGHTAPAGDPSRRIDYIWVSPDLRVVDFSLVGGRASDHLGVVATVE